MFVYIHYLPNTSLSTQVPHLELEVFIRDLLHIEPDCRYRSHHLSDLKFVQDRGLPGSVQSEDQNTHFTSPQQPPEVTE